MAKLAEFNMVFDKLFNEFSPKWGEVPFANLPILHRLQCLFYACAICHNINWDFLCRHIIIHIFNNTNGFDPNKLIEFEIHTFRGLFKEYDKPYKIEAETRLDIIRILANETNLGFFKSLLQASSLYGPGGFLTMINKLKIFGEDPLHKKSNLLAHFVLREKMIQVVDQGYLEPAIDYHVIRVYLRTGKVNVRSDELRRRLVLKDKFKLEEIILLRYHIAETMRTFCSKYNRCMAQLCFVDWIVGREYCHAETPACSSGCPTRSICMSSNLPINDMMFEPISNHGFY